jgi:hypothetical protein
MEDGFRISLYVCAGLSIAGGAIAWAMIRADLLSDDESDDPEADCYSCDVAGPRLHGDREPAVQNASRA